MLGKIEGRRRRGQDGRGWDGWMASLTRWAWVWITFGSWRWTGRPGVLQSMGSPRVRYNWATELNWIVQDDHMICCPNYDSFENKWVLLLKNALGQQLWTGIPSRLCGMVTLITHSSLHKTLKHVTRGQKGKTWQRFSRLWPSNRNYRANQRQVFQNIYLAN